MTTETEKTAFRDSIDAVARVTREVMRRSVEQMEALLTNTQVLEASGGVHPSEGVREYVRAVGHQLHIMHMAQRHNYNPKRIEDIAISRAALRVVARGVW